MSAPNTYIERACKILDNSDDSSDEVICGAVLLAAYERGAKIRRVSKATEIPAKRLRFFFDNFLANGVFTAHGEVFAEWFHDEHGVIAFVLDVAVGRGLLKKVSQ